MSAKTSHRRVQGTMKRGGRTEHIPLDMASWVMVDGNGIEHTIYTLGDTPTPRWEGVRSEA